MNPVEMVIESITAQFDAIKTLEAADKAENSARMAAAKAVALGDYVNARAFIDQAEAAYKVGLQASATITF